MYGKINSNPEGMRALQIIANTPEGKHLRNHLKEIIEGALNFWIEHIVE